MNKIKSNQAPQFAQTTLLIHLITRYALGWGLIGFALMLIAEIVFPGFVARIVPPAAILILLTLLLTITTITYSHLIKSSNIKPDQDSNSDKDKNPNIHLSTTKIILLLAIATPPILLVLRKFNTIETIIITALTLTAIFIFAKKALA